MNLEFKPAVKYNSKIRLLFTGPAGSGKTYSALSVASSMPGRIAVIDSEHGRASKYSDDFTFDVLELTEFSMANYIAAIKAADRAGYDILIIDSLSHAWSGTGGALEMVDKASANANKFTSGWGKVTPLWNQFIEVITSCGMHVIGTMRVSSDYVIEVNSSGKSVPRKIGLKPVFRDNGEYEFDVITELSIDHLGTITKGYAAIDGKQFDKPGKDLAEELMTWLQGKVRPEDEVISDKDAAIFIESATDAGWTEAEYLKLISSRYKSVTEIQCKYYDKLLALLNDSAKHQEVIGLIMQDNGDTNDA